MDRKLAVTYAYFLHNSLQKKYLGEDEVKDLCSKMPIVDNDGRVTKTGRGVVVLVPANGSKWVELIGSNPWRQHSYVELGEDYTRSMIYFGDVTSGKELVSFLQKYVKASDVPNLSPPNAAIPTLSSPLSKGNTFLLLDWIHYIKTEGLNLPKMFLTSIKGNHWLKISLSGSHGYCPPSDSFLLDSSILQNGSMIVDIPIVDQNFYGEEIKSYKDELETIGVRFHDTDACKFIGKRLMDLAASSKLTRDNFISILKFIKYLGANYISPGEFITSVKGEKWVRTSQGDMNPTNSVLFSQEWNAASQISEIPFIDQVYYGEELLSFKEELSLLGVFVNFSQSYQLVLENLKSSSSLASLSSEAMFLILTCIKSLESSDKLVQAINDTKCLKTNLGYKCPSECFLLNPESQWGCLLQVFESFPVLDEQFYGSSIFSMSNELQKIGVMVNFEDAMKILNCTFKQQASLSLIKKEHVLSFLQCCRKLEELDIKFSVDFQNCICNEKWIGTRLGDYRSPNECILFGTDWEPFSPICVLPFIDDSFYGNVINDYREELKGLGVVTDFKDGSKFVADGIFLPQDTSTLTLTTVYSLLESVKKLKEKETEIPEKFQEELSKNKWLKTYFGYTRPDECLLFDSAQDFMLKCHDGPFIDEGFYGSRIESYRNELNILGVITDTKNKCQFVAGYLSRLTNFGSISRIYNFLSTYKWEPVDEDNKKICIPKGTDNGEWVMPQDCVLRDNNNLFSKQLKVLENCEYEKEILDLFANTFNVKVHPSVDDYCKLWKSWESLGRQITHDEGCAFWEFVVRNWYPRTEDAFRNNLLKLPVLDPNSNGIILCDKRDVFIGDDLFLTDLFKSCSRPIFLWFPQPSLKTVPRTKLVDIYTKLGVRTLSESVQKIISDVDHTEFKPVISKEKIIKKGLIKLILGFLADPNLKIEPEKRHETVSGLLAIEAFETPENMTIRYRLSLSCGDVVDVEPRRMIRWDKQQSKLYMQKMDRSSCHKYVMEYAFHFAEEIAEGVLWENDELVPDLSELIRSGYSVEFDEEAIEFLMKMKNLQIFVEDEDYLSSTFSSPKGNLQEIASPRGKKRQGNNSMASSSSYELRSTKIPKRRDTLSLPH